LWKLVSVAAGNPRILPEARIAMRAVADQLCDLQKRIKQIEQAIRAWHRRAST